MSTPTSVEEALSVENPLSILTYAEKQGYSLFLVNDDNGHWAIVDDSMDTLGHEPYWSFTGAVYPHQWKGSPEQALLDYARSEGWLNSD